jgi:hypothetical protein
MHAASIRETGQPDSGRARAGRPALASLITFCSICLSRERSATSFLIWAFSASTFVQAAQLGRSKASVLLLPIVEGGLADSKLPADLLDLDAGFGLAQGKDDLRLGELRCLHGGRGRRARYSGRPRLFFPVNQIGGGRSGEVGKLTEAFNSKPIARGLLSLILSLRTRPRHNGITFRQTLNKRGLPKELRK